MARARGIPPRSRSSPMLYMMVVQALKQFTQLEQKPPVTVALILINVIAFFRPGELVQLLPSTAEVCLNPHLVWKHWDVKRLLGSAFSHADETHLVYNMVSLLWKGVQLEGALGSPRFLQLLAMLTLLAQGCTILVARLMADQLGIKIKISSCGCVTSYTRHLRIGHQIFDDVVALAAKGPWESCPCAPHCLDGMHAWSSRVGPHPLQAPYYQQCAVGFSGVLFALKVLLNWHSPTSTTVAGFPMPTRYAAWAELVAIQYATPDASFVGHLGGIVAGGMLVYIPRVLPRGLPFVAALRALAPTTLASTKTGRVETQRKTRWFSSWGSRGSQRSNIRESRDEDTRRGRGSRGGFLSRSFRKWFRSAENGSRGWACRACTYQNQAGSNCCGMCEYPRSQSSYSQKSAWRTSSQADGYRAGQAQDVEDENRQGSHIDGSSRATTKRR